MDLCDDCQVRVPTTKALAPTERIAGAVDLLRMQILTVGWTAP